MFAHRFRFCYVKKNSDYSLKFNKWFMFGGIFLLQIKFPKSPIFEVTKLDI